MTGRATWHPAEGQWGEWHCYACGEVLAIGAGYAQAVLNARAQPRRRANIRADLVPASRHAKRWPDRVRTAPTAPDIQQGSSRAPSTTWHVHWTPGPSNLRVLPTIRNLR